jgi:hypothetical protein
MKMRLPGILMTLAACAAGIACVTAPVQRVYVPTPVAPAPAPEPAYEPPPPAEEAPAGAEDQPFYEDLAPYGRWAYVSGPGWVWSPYSVQAGWCPYQLGHWVYTDYGWTWASDENFGWAVYHYGRWNNDPSYGWVWVPGTEWGPAWVAWHEGGGYVGWAPLPYQAQWRAGFGLDWGGININVAIGPTWWHFVQTRDMVDPGLRYRVVPPSRNVTLIQITRNVTNYTYIDNRVVDHSVRVETIGRAVGHTIPTYRVRPSETPEVARGGRVRGEDFVVFRPNAVRGAKSQGRIVPPGHDEAHHPGDRWREEPRQDAPPQGTQPNTSRPGPPPGTDNDQSRSSRYRKAREQERKQDRYPHQQPPAVPPGQPATTDQGAGQGQPGAPPSDNPTDNPPSHGRRDGGTQNPGSKPEGVTPDNTRDNTRDNPPSHGRRDGATQNPGSRPADVAPGKPEGTQPQHVAPGQSTDSSAKPGQGNSQPARGKGKGKKGPDAASKGAKPKPDSPDTKKPDPDKAKQETSDSGN